MDGGWGCAGTAAATATTAAASLDLYGRANWILEAPKCDLPTCILSTHTAVTQIVLKALKPSK